jgi:hypothetical protein
MSNSTDDLKSSIMALIANNDYSLNDLNAFLDPISKYVNDPNLMSGINGIVEEITKDRDGNGQFNIDDLKLLGSDMLGITSLVNSVLLVIGSIPEIKLQYSAGATEEIVFKALAFIFLVVVPKQTGHPWDAAEKEQVVDLVLAIYNVVKSSQIVQALIQKIAAYFKSKGWCKCMFGEPATTNQDVIDNHLPQARAELSYHVQRIKTASRTQRELHALRSEVEKLKSLNQ